jgi:hypothetical protein
MNDLRVEVRFRNNVLWHAIFDVYASVAAFCRVARVDPGSVGAYLNLKTSPYLTSGGLSWRARRVVTAVALPAEELFPPELYAACTGAQARSVLELDSRTMVGLGAASRVALPPAQDGLFTTEDREGLISAALSHLSPVQGEVLRRRFGLAPFGATQTLEGVGRVLHLTRERVRQIEMKAVRRLRHPRFSRVLRELTSTIGED